MSLHKIIPLFIIVHLLLNTGCAVSQEKIEQYKICEGAHQAVVPVMKTGRDWWLPRHEAVLDAIEADGENIGMIFIGDSITHAWETRGAQLWQQYYAQRKPLNLGFSGDRTQNVLWRLDNGEIDGINPKIAVVMIGTNNVTDNLKAGEVADGIVAVCKRLRAKLPQTKILLLAVFPRDEKITETRLKVQKINKIISCVADNGSIFYLDISDAFVDGEGIISSELMDDFLHPTEAGYLKWAQAMEPMIERLWNN